MIENNNGSSEKISIIAGISMLVIVLGAFAWLWFAFPKPDVSTFRSTDNLTPVSVAGVESQAKSLMEGLKNNAGIPIPPPTAKMGRTDPFASL